MHSVSVTQNDTIVQLLDAQRLVSIFLLRSTSIEFNWNKCCKKEGLDIYLI